MKRKEPITLFAEGDVLWATNNYNKSGRPSHHIIYLAAHDTDPLLFIGGMLTHATGYGNHKLQSYYFKYYDSEGYQCSVGYNNSLVASKKLIKKLDWGPYYKRGEITPDGIQFICSKISHLPAEVYYDNAY